MLRFAEEIMLLILDDSGEFVAVPTWPLHCALGGGVLMDLALEGRIDTDPERLFVVDPTPVGDDLLDSTLARIAETPDTFDARHWVRTMANGAGRIRRGCSNDSSSTAFWNAGNGASCGCCGRGATRRWTASPTGR